MNNIASYLRESREKKGLTIEDVEKATRVPAHYLEILEGHGDDRLVSDRLYLLHYLRNYADFLDLNAEAIAIEYVRETNRSTARPSVASETQRRRLNPLLLLSMIGLSGALVFAVALYQGFLRLNPSKRITQAPSSHTPAVTEDDEAIRATSPAALDQGSPAPAGDGTSERITVLQPEALSRPNTARTTAVPPMENQTEVALEPDNLESSNLGEPAAAGSTGSQGTAASDQAALQRLKIEATETAWIRVIVDGKDRQDMTLNPGDSREWSAENGFVLTFGNAGGVNLTLNGKELPPIGTSGQVVRNMALP